MQRTLFLNAMFLLLPLSAVAQPPGQIGNNPNAQRLPPPVYAGSTPEPHPFSSVPKPLPQSIRPARFTQPVPQPPPEKLPPGIANPTPMQGSGLTLADLETMAMAGNPSVARLAALVQAARGNHVQVGLPPNPTVGYEGQQIGSRGLAEQDGVFVSQEIVRGGKLKLNRQIAAQEWARAEQDLAAQQQRVLTDVRIGFYQVLTAQQQEKLTNDLLRLANETLQTAENLFKGKEVGRLDVVNAQLEVENADILAQNARNRRVSSWQSLSAVIGNPHLPLQPLAGDLEQTRGKYEWEESLQRVLSTSPEIAAAMTNIERARWTVQRALVEKTPNITVQGLVNARDNGIGGRSDGALMVGIPLPLWNRNQGAVIQAQNEAMAAERNLEQIELSIRNRMAPVYERYANALHQVNKYRTKILPGAQDSLNLSRQLYRAGETGYVTLLTGQRNFSQHNFNYLDSLRELRKAEAEIEGLLLSGSLDTR